MFYFLMFRFNVAGAKNVTLLVEKTNKSLQNQLKENIEKGTYIIGDLIVPQTFEMTKIRNNKIVVEDVTIHERRIPIVKIRQKMLEEHLCYMRLRTHKDFKNLTGDEITNELKCLGELPNDSLSNETLVNKLKSLERTRHLMFWHDGSTLANHSHILMTDAAVYNPAVYFRDEEFFEKNKRMINIQAEVEKPFLYIMARCPSNEQQLLCAEERMKDILNLNEDLALLTGIKIHDVFHFFKGDAPARQFEAGHQKGGNYVCVACSIHCNLIHDLVHSYSLQNMSLEDRINKIRSSTRSCDKLKKNCTKLYENLKWHEFEDELHQRKIKNIPHNDIRTGTQIIRIRNAWHAKTTLLIFQQSYV